MPSPLWIGGIGEVRQGRVIEPKSRLIRPAFASKRGDAKQLLANPVTEIYAIEIIASG
jgi:phosphoribosylformylglycinamidine (FGAM) synthase PurS component